MMKLRCFLLCYLYLLTSTYAQEKNVQPVNLAIVLGTSIQGENPSPAFQQRIDHGIFLYKTQKVSRLLFSGGKVDGNKYSEAEVAAKYAIQNGVPFNDIIIEDQSKNTIENFKFSKKIIDTLSLDTIYIVTDSIHIKRAMMIANANQLKALASPSSLSHIKNKTQKFKYRSREMLYRFLNRIIN